MTALQHFIARSAEKCLPFFDTLRGAKNFEWTPECQFAFEEIKKYLSKPPLITKVLPREEVYLYIASSPKVVETVLNKEEDGIQKPIYYVSHALKDAMTRYPDVEKFAYALVIAAQKLRPYFQGRTIKMLTDKPLRRILHKPELLGRMVREWWNWENLT